MTTNIKYILLFDTTPHINDTKDTVYFNNTPINKDTTIQDIDNSLQVQYAITETINYRSIDKDKPIYKIKAEISQISLDKIFFHARFENGNINYYYNNSSISSINDIIILKIENTENIIKIQDGYRYDIYYNIITDSTINLNNENDKRKILNTLYFIVICEQGTNNIIQITKDKINYDSNDLKNITINYFKKNNSQTGLYIIERIDDINSIKLLKSSKLPILKIVVDSNGIYSQLNDVLNLVKNDGFSTIYAKTQGGLRKRYLNNSISSPESFDNKSKSISYEVDKFFTETRELPFLIYIDDNPEIFLTETERESDKTEIYYGEYKLVDKDKDKEIASSIPIIIPFSDDISLPIENNNYLIVKLPTNQNGFSNNELLQKKLKKIIEQLQRSNKNVLFVTDFDCTITSVHLWGIYNNNLKYVTKEKIDRFYKIKHTDYKNSFFFETNEVTPNGIENLNRIRNFFFDIYKQYNPYAKDLIPLVEPMIPNPSPSQENSESEIELIRFVKDIIKLKTFDDFTNIISINNNEHNFIYQKPNSKSPSIIFKGFWNGVPCYFKIFSSTHKGLLYEQYLYNYIKTRQTEPLLQDNFVKVLDLFKMNKKEKDVFSSYIKSKVSDIDRVLGILNRTDNICFIVTEDIGGKGYFDFIFNKRQQLDINLLKETIFEIIYSIYLLNTHLKIVHNDLHFDNILIKEESKPTIKEYIINGKRYSKPRKYKICIYDFDKSYMENVSNLTISKIPYINKGLIENIEKGKDTLGVGKLFKLDLLDNVIKNNLDLKSNLEKVIKTIFTEQIYNTEIEKMCYTDEKERNWSLYCTNSNCSTCITPNYGELLTSESILGRIILNYGKELNIVQLL